MKKNRKLAPCAAAMTLLCALPVHATVEQDKAEGLLEGQSLQILNRALYEGLDYRHGDRFYNRKLKVYSDQAVEAGYGLMATYQSGFTQGIVGFGVDAHAYGAVNLNRDNIHNGRERYLPTEADGESMDDYGRAGAAVKIRASSTTLKYGEMRTKNPIFNSSDTRLLPETNTGWLLTSKNIPDLSLQAGHFTGWSDRTARRNDNPLRANYITRATRSGDSFSFVGGTWSAPIKALSLTAYAGNFEDFWNTYYLGSTYSWQLANRQSLSYNLNIYRNTDTGSAYAGKVDNTTWSLMSTYALGAHKFGIGYQKVHGDTPFDYVNRGSIWLDNAMQISDFNGPHEASWQTKYEVDLGEWFSPGLSASIGYTRGSDIDGSKADPRGAYAYYGKDGKHWERDMLVRYTVRDGAAKGLAFHVRYSVHRNNEAHRKQGEYNIDQVRLGVEFPLSL
ncbi:OprD family outer membrane porin [Microvirgula aerodenitrificans]|uniref:OprD family outer membrane porin n=1 Tax=Microvirgula aerodenitrificans TaxID=57480 RepID=UPI000AB238E0|nr:OprD family outer membrane porin [Microvirgula aerodenitrificans]